MKVIGYGWIKSGDTLQKAMETYGVPNEIKEGEQTIKAEKGLFATINDASKDFKKAIQAKKARRSAKPRYFRVILDEIDRT